MKTKNFRAWNTIVKRISDTFTFETIPNNTQWHILKIDKSTGLKSIENKELFFNDIVLLTKGTAKGIPFLVTTDDFDIPLFLNDNSQFISIEFSQYFLNGGDRNGFKIVGNIYENKDLLSSSKL